MNNFSTTIIIAFVIYIAAFGKLANYAKIATTSGWSGTPPSGNNAAASSSSGGGVGDIIGGAASIAKAIPIIGGLF